ncbi:hypothetical protein BC831DRAFT_517640 [Entophlyctis helioformis]|nr:hypothetical protein BC831DRAFT_517640 [Entophlyctis helioformis]
MSLAARILLLLALCLGAVHAHFQLVTPPPRLYDDLLEFDPPCGGSNTTMARIAFPQKGGVLSIKAFHGNANMTFNIAFKDPLVQQDFTAKFLPDRVIATIGPYSLGPHRPVWTADAKNGANATLQLTFSGGDGMLYQCTDIVIDSKLNTASAAVGGRRSGAYLASISAVGAALASLAVWAAL